MPEMNENKVTAVSNGLAGLMALDQRLILTVLALAAIAAVLFLGELVARRKILGRLGYAAMVGATLGALAELVTRYAYMVRFDANYFPLTNLFESIMFMVFASLAIYLIVERIFHPAAFGLVCSGLVTMIMGLASLLPPRLRDAQPLVPSLQSYWLKIHVSLMMISYAALFISFITAALYLFFHYRDRGQTPVSEAGQDVSPIEMLDEATFRLILLGFPILGFGIIAGALWANHAWGTYWSWDPKETWALITWLFYAAYLHMRVSRDWKGAPAAWFAGLGFVSVMVTYLGVNYLASGLHTYGKLM